MDALKKTSLICLNADLPHEKINSKEYVKRLHDVLQIKQNSPEPFVECLPFSANDTTAGAENELQTVVIGEKGKVDFPVNIEASNYYKNIIKRFKRGETPKKLITDLEKYMNDNPDKIWENS